MGSHSALKQPMEWSVMCFHNKTLLVYPQLSGELKQHCLGVTKHFSALGREHHADGSGARGRTEEKWMRSVGRHDGMVSSVNHTIENTGEDRLSRDSLDQGVQGQAWEGSSCRVNCGGKTRPGHR